MRRGFRYYFDVELFDRALLYGMTPDEYWFGDPAMLENYAHLYESRRKQADEDAWLTGRYVLSALQSHPVPVWLILSTTASPIKDSNNELIGIVSNTRNITDLINLKNELSDTKELTLKYSEELKKLRQHFVKDKDFIYQSKEMDATVRLAGRVAQYDSTVLIHGESGTGKEVLAKYIHSNSPRKDESFIKVNCAAIPKDLFESELFGYEEGAFTGAGKNGKPGMFELANDGTILLDEVGELPLPVQSKLLRVIQEREIYRVGGKNPITLDVRIIAATNRDLK